MALSQRFSYVSCDFVNISNLKVDQSHPIVKAERVKTRYGETVLLSTRDPQNLSVRDLSPALLKVFLPKRYATVITDADITSINDEQFRWNLISKGVCERTNTYVLAIEYVFFAFQMTSLGERIERDNVISEIEKSTSDTLIGLWL